MNLKEAALKFLENGINVIPFKTWKAGDKWHKKPAVEEASPYHTNKLKVSSIDKVFTERANSIAIACGKISGNLISIDVENSNYSATSIYNKLKSEYGNLIEEYKIPIVKSRSGGFHVDMRVTGEKAKIFTKNKPIAKYKDFATSKDQILVEVRGQGFFCNTYPSDGYEMMDNDIFEIPVVPDFVIHDLFTFFSTFDCRAERYDDSVKVVDKNRPEYQYNIRKEHQSQIKTLLLAKGWAISATKYKNETEYYELRRPGKTEGTSATFLYPSKDDNQTPGLYIFTSNCHPFPRDGFFSLFDCLKYLQFDGSYDKSISTLVASGIGYMEDYVILDSTIKNAIFMGTKEAELMQALPTQQRGYTPEFLKKRVDYLYKIHEKEFGLKHKPEKTIIEYILKKKYNLWVNEYGNILMKGDEQVDSTYYWARLAKDYGIKMGDKQFDTYIRSGVPLPVKNLIKSFFDNAPTYDPDSEDRYINQFTTCLYPDESVADIKSITAVGAYSGIKLNTLQAFHTEMLFKHMIRSVSQFFERKVNRYIYILRGLEQTYKSSYIRFLGSFLPTVYFAEERFKNITIDTKYKACRTFINNIEEFEGVRNIDDLKEIISKENFNDRIAHQKNVKSAVRITNYFGSTNADSFLPFDQENTRMITMPIDHIDGRYDSKHAPGERNIDCKNLWREAFYYYRTFVAGSQSGYKKYCELTKEEKEIQRKINDVFTNGSPVLYGISKTIKVPTAYSKTVNVNLNDIQDLIRDNMHIAPQYKREESLNKKAMRMAMTELGFDLIRKRRYTDRNGKSKQGDYYVAQLIIND